MERIRAEATALQQSDSPLACEQDALAQVLVHWFKHEYFKWADPIKCPRCAGPTSASGMVPPTPYERSGGAGRVELHVCRGENGACDGSFRFPRYKDPKRSQVSDENAYRKMWGMGEFVHVIPKGAFSLHDLQLVWNKEDHVWNEYFSPGAGRWIHTDSCEAARDQPLLYDRGWGKKMSYIFAFSIDGASDMSRGYVQNSNEMLQRRKDAPEPSPGRGARQDHRSSTTTSDTAELAQPTCPEGETEREAEAAAEPARESGTQEWKEARGEAGPGSR
ncbi:Transglutaminase/protease-like protein [Rhizoctonia solani]|uniref:Transglutaminase/protease-like protein n=1 Tax=Rhizoctonia solani TaxID=456999 RepID=A0A8H7I813_9AGAM|nr:Transglutaminase/protease-like protein [Rhizoctonia solani]